MTFGIPRREEEKSAREVGGFGYTKKESDNHEMRIRGSCSGASTDDTPETYPGRYIDRRSDLGEDVVGRQLTENVADKEYRDGDVELVALEI